MLITETSQAHITIKRSPGRSVATQFLLGVVSLGFGSLFFIIGEEDKPLFVYFISGLFVFAGLALLLHLPEYYKKVSADGGDIIFKATNRGIVVAPVMNGPELFYEWHLVDSVCFADVGRGNAFANTGIGDGLKDYGSGGVKGINRNVILVKFKPAAAQQVNRNWLTNKKNNISKTPKGRFYTYSEYAADEKSATIAALIKLAPTDVKIDSLSEITFDYSNNTEVYK